MFALSKLATVCIVIACQLIAFTSGHGRLIEPPSRASAWRYGFNTPHNYNDHELYCGGFSRQWQKNGGKCGVCGDAWDAKAPRAHEFGGTYGQGVIVRKYRVKQVINIRVELTASHFGYFEFAVCPNYKSTTQDCLNKNILQIIKPQEGVDHHNSRYFPKDGNKVYEMKYRLPDMSCSHCLLQWRYIAGNNWGNCPNGTGAVGCGPQEEFRACADIKIGSKDASDDDYNEIPATDDSDQDNLNQDSTEKPAYTPTTSIFITLISFLVISLALFLIYFHFYRVGTKLKTWIAAHPIRFYRKEKEPPMPPPRGVKKTSLSGKNDSQGQHPDGMFEINLTGVNAKQTTNVPV